MSSLWQAAGVLQRHIAKFCIDVAHSAQSRVEQLEALQCILLPARQHTVSFRCQIEEALQELNRRNPTPLVRRMPTQNFLERPLQLEHLGFHEEILLVWQRLLDPDPKPLDVKEDLQNSIQETCIPHILEARIAVSVVGVACRVFLHQTVRRQVEIEAVHINIS